MDADSGVFQPTRPILRLCDLDPMDRRLVAMNRDDPLYHVNKSLVRAAQDKKPCLLRDPADNYFTWIRETRDWLSALTGGYNMLVVEHRRDLDDMMQIGKSVRDLLSDDYQKKIHCLLGPVLNPTLTQVLDALDAIVCPSVRLVLAGVTKQLDNFGKNFAGRPTDKLWTEFCLLKERAAEANVEFNRDKMLAQLRAAMPSEDKRNMTCDLSLTADQMWNSIGVQVQRWRYLESIDHAVSFEVGEHGYDRQHHFRAPTPYVPRGRPALPASGYRGRSFSRDSRASSRTASNRSRSNGSGGYRSGSSGRGGFPRRQYSGSGRSVSRDRQQRHGPPRQASQQATRPQLQRDGGHGTRPQQRDGQRADGGRGGRSQRRDGSVTPRRTSSTASRQSRGGGGGRRGGRRHK